jgi:hypothetical protein
MSVPKVRYFSLVHLEFLRELAGVDAASERVLAAGRAVCGVCAEGLALVGTLPL